MPDPNSLTPQSPGKFGCLGVLGWVLAAAALTIALTLLLFWRMSAEITQDARRMAESIAASFDRTLKFTPQISVDSVVVIAANAPVLELVTVQKQALVRSRWTHTWLHSTKNLELEATFTAKAGFDLTEPFRINIDPRTRAVSAAASCTRTWSCCSAGKTSIMRDTDCAVSLVCSVANTR